MQKKRPLSTMLLGLAAVATAPTASALGWGRAPQTAVLGQSLDFNVSLRLDPGDFVDPKCVNAEVVVGDQRLPAPAIRVGVDTSNPEVLAIRVVSGPAIEEPVATVTVAIGCPARLSRRFVLLVDPPSTAPTVLPPATIVAEAPPAPRTAAPVEAPAPAPAVAPAAVEAPRAASPAPRATPAEPSAAPPPRPAARPARKPAPAVARAAPQGGSRLQLEAVEPVAAKAPAMAASAVEEALQAVSQAASAARAAASAASAAETRVATLEREMLQLRAEADRNREQAAQMRDRLAAAESSSRWFTPLLLLVVALAALAAWLGLRLREAGRARQRAWQAAAAAVAQRPDTPTSQLPMVTSEIMAPPSTHPGRAPIAAGIATPAPAMAVMNPPRPDDLPVPPTERTDVQPRAPGEGGAARDVSIEELLDLEQQAEFFIVLGQEDAAVDLLVDHLRDTGGGSPLPYLKLLEIYKRRNDREAYERTRARFNHRFNAYAPDWDTDLLSGRSLEDYPGVVPRLQQVWGRPLDAMAELEALLFRKSRGQLFDLPAYREVLFLYSLARDLLDREAADSGNVDLLLPLSDGADFGVTAPHPFLALERESVFDTSMGTLDDKPTAPVDLDLTQPEAQPPIVDPLTPKR